MPAPLVSAHVDLSRLPYIKLDVSRLKTCDFTSDSSGDSFRAGILLWCAAWHQVPAASLPSEDSRLMIHAGFGRSELELWLAVKDKALHGFILCDDGRLYHPYLAKLANECAAESETNSRSAKERWKKVKPTLPPPVVEEAPPEERPEESPEDAAKRERRLAQIAKRTADFATFWEAYPSKKDKGRSTTAFNREWNARKGDIAQILERLEVYKTHKPADWQWMHPTTWLNGRIDDVWDAPTQAQANRGSYSANDLARAGGDMKKAAALASGRSF